MTEALDVLFIWHFHQPYYGTPGDSEFFLPWVRLHSVKAYYDMARHLEDTPGMKATFNFSGSLLRQIEEIVDHKRRDRWWRWSLTDPDDLTPGQRKNLVHHFFSVNHERFVYPVDRYRELLQQRIEEGIEACAESYTRQDFLDLQCLFNLAWCGHFARQDFPLIDELYQKGRDFTGEDIAKLLDLHLEITSRVLPLYRRLLERNQIEISLTPMFHPILPLLIDTDAAARATPQRPRPQRYQSDESARWHVQAALDLGERLFGQRPQGMWPSEGSVSPEALKVFADAGLKWIGTDEEILRHSRTADYHRSRDLWQPWTLKAAGSAPQIFFRDRGLSDLIGFTYSKNHPEEGADDLLRNLNNIAADTDRPASVAIILDGENPWEHYEDDGYPFLKALYERLHDSSTLQTNTPTGLSQRPAGELTHLHSGSWIMGNYQIWIGHSETNLAWNWVRQADEFYHAFLAQHPEHPGQTDALEALHIAQGSDWFWWYGDDFSSEQDAHFDALFRSLIARVYTALGELPPPELDLPIAGSDRDIDSPPPRFFESRHYISPAITGKPTGFFDWSGAGLLRLSGGHGAMFENFRPFKEIRFGFSNTRFFLRLIPGPDFDEECRLLVHLADETLELRPSQEHRSETLETAFFDVAELAIHRDALDLKSAKLPLQLEVLRRGIKLYQFPENEPFLLDVPAHDPAHKNWLV